MEDRDIDMFVRAKRENIASTILLVSSLCMMNSLIFLDSFQIEHEYTIFLATLSMVLVVASMGSSRWVSVTKDDLLDIIQRHINSDPKAIDKLAKRS